MPSRERRKPASAGVNLWSLLSRILICPLNTKLWAFFPSIGTETRNRLPGAYFKSFFDRGIARAKADNPKIPREEIELARHDLTAKMAPRLRWTFLLQVFPFQMRGEEY